MKTQMAHLLLSPLDIFLLLNRASVPFCIGQYETKSLVHLAWVVLVKLMILNFYLFELKDGD